MERRIEIRLTQTEQKSYEKGKVIRTPGADPVRIGELVRPELEAAIHEKYGDDTELTFSVAQVTDVRLLGTFPRRPRWCGPGWRGCSRRRWRTSPTWSNGRELILLTQRREFYE